MIIKTVRETTPVIGKNCFVAEDATIVGDVIIGDDCSIWYKTVIRGDVNHIRIGNRVNIQDACVLHTTYKKTVIRLGNDVSVGHRVLLHGATVEDEVLIGMGAILMDHVRVGTRSIIAAGALLLENTIVEPYSIWAGLPAKKIGEVTEEQVEQLILSTAKSYMKYARWYLKGGRMIEDQ